MSLYAEQIIDLYKNPLNQGSLTNPSVSHRAYNPLCGDDITVDLKITGQTVTDIRHRGVGCAISKASISLLTEQVKGKKMSQVMHLRTEDLVKLIGIELGPVRLKCALLGLEAIQQAIQKYLQPSI